MHVVVMRMWEILNFMNHRWFLLHVNPSLVYYHVVLPPSGFTMLFLPLRSLPSGLSLCARCPVGELGVAGGHHSSVRLRLDGGLSRANWMGSIG